MPCSQLTAPTCVHLPACPSCHAARCCLHVSHGRFDCAMARGLVAGGPCSERERGRLNFLHDARSAADAPTTTNTHTHTHRPLILPPSRPFSSSLCMSTILGSPPHARSPPPATTHYRRRGDCLPAVAGGCGVDPLDCHGGLLQVGKGGGGGSWAAAGWVAAGWTTSPSPACRCTSSAQDEGRQLH